MADNTAIEWCDATWQPVTGCSVVSPGCTNCYAMRLAGTRLQHHWSRKGLTRDSKAGPVWTGEVRFNEQWLDQPLRWRRPRRIFVCAHGDLFAGGVPDEWIDRVFAVMALAGWHQFLVLTKRAMRLRDYISQDRMGYIEGRAKRLMRELSGNHTDPVLVGKTLAGTWPWPHVWLGVSAEDQTRADERIPLLLDTPAAKRFVSLEPLLGPIDLTRIDGAALDGESAGIKLDALVGGRQSATPWHLDWVIAGGESGRGARPMHPDWPRALRDQCAAAGVPYFFKQWGSHAPIEPERHLPGNPRRVCAGDVMIALDGQSQVLSSDLGCDFEAEATPMRQISKKAAGRLLDGREHSEIPA